MAITYTPLRFLANNLLTASMITASSQAGGRIGGTQKTGSGSANMIAAGNYIGIVDMTVIVQIDAVGTGEIGSATFAWKTSETVSGWEASGVTTSTSMTALGSDGKQIAFVAGDDVDFVAGDTWVFPCYATFSPARILDLDRDLRFRSGVVSSPITLTIDLGSAQTITAVLLQDHNLTSAATITLSANSSNSWTTPPYTQALTQTDDPIVYYLSQTYRYWRINITDTANPANYIEIGELYLGTYTALVSEYNRIPWGSQRTNGYNRLESTSYVGKTRRRCWTQQEQIPITLNMISNADFDILQALYESLHNVNTGVLNPLWFHYFYDTPSECFLVDWLSDLPRTFRSYGLNTITINFAEVVTTR